MATEKYFTVTKVEKDGKTLYCVAHWNGQSGKYEYPAKGGGTWFGSAWYAGKVFDSQKQAKAHARYMNGK